MTAIVSMGKFCAAFNCTNSEKKSWIVFLSASQMFEKKKTMGSCPEQDRPSIRAAGVCGELPNTVVYAAYISYQVSFAIVPSKYTNLVIYLHLCVVCVHFISSKHILWSCVWCFLLQEPRVTTRFHTPNMAAHKMICLKLESAYKSSIRYFTKSVCDHSSMIASVISMIADRFCKISFQLWQKETSIVV